MLSIGVGVAENTWHVLSGSSLNLEREKALNTSSSFQQPQGNAEELLTNNLYSCSSKLPQIATGKFEVTKYFV